VKAHSGIIHNEIADTLATRGVKGSTYCPIDWFDKLPADTEEEDDLSIPPSEVITQTEEFGADEEHLPSYGTQAVVYGFVEEESAERAEEERERSIRHFIHDTLDNSSTPVTDDEDLSDTGGTLTVRPEMTVVDDGSEQPEPPREPGFSMQIGYESSGDIPDSIPPSPWSSTWAQAKAEEQQRREAEERFSWIKDADLQMLTMGLEPYPWDQFADAIKQSGEWQCQAIEQRTCNEEVMQTGEPPGPHSLVGATLVVRSHTIVTAMNMVSYGWNASEATARMLVRMAEALPEGAHLDLIISTDIVLAALGTCADILTKGCDMDQYCQVREWKELMILWKNRQLHAVVRKGMRMG
jgi:hypothetical protein